LEDDGDSDDKIELDDADVVVLESLLDGNID